MPASVPPLDTTLSALHDRRCEIEDLLLGGAEISMPRVIEARNALDNQLSACEHKLSRARDGRVLYIQLRGFIEHVDAIVHQPGAEDPNYVFDVEAFDAYCRRLYNTRRDERGVLVRGGEARAKHPDSRIVSTRRVTEPSGAASAAPAASAASAGSAGSAGASKTAAAAVSDVVEGKGKGKMAGGFSFQVQDLAVPVVMAVSVQTQVNGDRRVAVMGNHFEEPVSVEVNGIKYDQPAVSVVRQGVGLNLMVASADWTDRGAAKNEIVVTCNGRRGEPYHCTKWDFENKPQIWAVGEADLAGRHKEIRPLAIRGQFFEPGRTQEVKVRVGTQDAFEIFVVDGTLIKCRVLEAGIDRNEPSLVSVTVADVQSDQFFRDFSDRPESDWMASVRENYADAPTPRAAITDPVEKIVYMEQRLNALELAARKEGRPVTRPIEDPDEKVAYMKKRLERLEEEASEGGQDKGGKSVLERRAAKAGDAGEPTPVGAQGSANSLMIDPKMRSEMEDGPNRTPTPKSSWLADFNGLVRVESHVRPVIQAVSVLIQPNHSRRLAIAGNYLEEPLAVWCNGVEAGDVKLVKQGVGLSAVLTAEQWTDFDNKNEVVVSSGGVKSKSYVCRFDYENKPSMWSVREKETDPTHLTIRGQNFGLGAEMGAWVSFDKEKATDVKIVDATTITCRVAAQLPRKPIIVDLHVAGMEATPFRRDFSLDEDGGEVGAAKTK